MTGQADAVAGVVVLGAGTIGRALLGQIAARRGGLHASLGVRLDVVAVATSRLWTPPGRAPLEDDDLRALAHGGIAAVEHIPHDDGQVRVYLEGLPRRAVVVDVTASDATADLLLAALAAGHHVVLANKKPLSADAATFAALMRYRAEGRMVRYEATVGAGLPVIRTLQDLVETGDEVLAIDAALSGTLGYICTALEDGTPFSRAVRAAQSAGYTEPDPRDDLSGRDVARKAVILARTCGFRADLADIALAGLGDLGAPGATVAAFLAGLEEQDGEMAARVGAAESVDQVLRYVARVTPEGTTAGLQAVPLHHPLAGLRGTANLVAITSARYRDVPLVVSGPGAGAAVTAAGVFADILAAVAARRWWT
jgi:homoserine dehydrogenase